MRYCVEFLSKRPTCSYQKSKYRLNSPIGSLISLGVDLKKETILYKIHYFTKKIDDARIILIIRNYKDAIVRRSCYKNLEAEELHDNLINRFRQNIRGKIGKTGHDYILPIKIFDKHKGEKLLIYYEDLLSDFKRTLKSVANFLNFGTEHLSGFLDNINLHRNNSLEIFETYSKSFYRKSQKSQKTQQNHRDRLSENQKISCDKIIKDKWSHLYNKYLVRYSEHA